MKIISICAVSLIFLQSYSQEEIVTESIEEDYNYEMIEPTFHSTRVINGHSVESLGKGVLEFRIEHRFGDIAGDEGGAQTFFGFDNSSDIRFAFEYGINDKLMIGLGRSKGTGAPYKSLMDGFVKYRAIKQEKGKSPLSLTVVGSSFFTYMTASEDLGQVSHFPQWQHRFAYSTQLNIARSFGKRLSLAVMPTLVHRNYVAQDDVNSLFAMGAAARIGISDTKAILLECYYGITDDDYRSSYKNSIGIAYEWITFGHNFTVNFTNSKGFGEAQFIPYTFSDWLKGQFRLGFCISRKFEKG